MSNKAITKNDLAAVLNEVLPPTPSEYKKLLWTNPSPTSSFSPQTISLDLSDYDEVEVSFINSSSSGYRYLSANIKCPIGEQAICDGIFGGSAVESGVLFGYARLFNVYTDSIAFANAAGCADNNSFAIRNEMCVPQKIYGIKYERVARPQVEYPNYSTEEQEVGTFIDGKTIYRKSKLYTWSGTTTYDNDFFSGISVDRIVRQRTQITKNANYAQESFYWSNTDYNRCWISLTNTPPVVAFACSQSAGCEILITVDYTKA